MRAYLGSVLLVLVAMSAAALSVPGCGSSQGSGGDAGGDGRSSGGDSASGDATSGEGGGSTCPNTCVPGDTCQAGTPCHCSPPQAYTSCTCNGDSMPNTWECQPANCGGCDDAGNCPDGEVLCYPGPSAMYESCNPSQSCWMH
jgi:hypothetical protein